MPNACYGVVKTCTSSFGPIEGEFSNSKLNVKRSNLLPQDEEVLDQKQLSIHRWLYMYNSEYIDTLG